MQDTAQGASVPEMPLDSFEAFEQYRLNPEAAEETAVEPAAPAAEEARTAPDSGTDEEQEEPKAEKGKGLQKRIDELTRGRREAERESAALKERIAELERGSRPAQNNAQPAARQEGEPKLENFDSYQEYYSALVDYRLDQREQAKAVQTAQKAAVDSWEQKQVAAREKHGDYDQVLESAEMPNTPTVPAIREALADSELGAEMLYHLAQNPAEAQRIAALSPIAAVRELGKIEAKLAANAAPEKPVTRKETSAPAPPRGVGGRFASTKAVNDPDIPFEEFEKRRLAQQRR